MNVTALDDETIKWADFVFISAMSIQKGSANEIIERCKKMSVKTVAGGPLFTTNRDDFEKVDHLVLNEAEITLPLFLEDLKNGCAKHIYTSPEWADVKTTPIPSWGLIKAKNYFSLNIQYSRGCPFNCEFCNIALLCGRVPRIKDKQQVLAELESIYDQGWRGGVFFVDDNFIGNREKLKKEILPAVVEWMEQRKYPFSFNTQASINLADDEELMRLMVQAGFNTVFIGIETPNKESLEECGKFQNKNRDLINCVKKIQQFGLEVQGGFIVGFDNDPASIFERQIKFIQESKIITAMVGLLNATPGTRLHLRLKKENRIVKDITGDNTDLTINFIPKMDQNMLLNGYKRILKALYSPNNYYQRVKGFLKNYQPSSKSVIRFHFYHVGAFFKSVLRLGIIGKERRNYWKLLFWTIFKRPRLFPLAVTFAIYGFHFQKIFGKLW